MSEPLPSPLFPEDLVPGQTWHPPRPDAEMCFYSVTVGRQPGVYSGTDDWSSQVSNIPGAAVRSFNSQSEAEDAYNQALVLQLVVQVNTVGERQKLATEHISLIPGLRVSDTVYDGKWYAITIGTEPGLYPITQNVTPLTSNVSGSKCKRWGSYELARNTFLEELENGLVVKDTTSIVRTTLSS